MVAAYKNEGYNKVDSMDLGQTVLGRTWVWERLFGDPF